MAGLCQLHPGAGTGHPGHRGGALPAVGPIDCGGRGLGDGLGDQAKRRRAWAKALALGEQGRLGLRAQAWPQHMVGSH